MTGAGDHVSWLTSRAAGIMALLLASAAVSCGLLVGLRLVRGRSGADVRALHEVLSLATLVALAVHVLSLLGDSYLRPSLADLTIPFVSGYQRWWTTTGIVAGWSLAVLGLSYWRSAWPAAGQAAATASTVASMVMAPRARATETRWWPSRTA
jgi:sulfoxide reductase heme-binding subunit YedZ